MKLSEQWLREWVNPSITSEELCTKLTMAGLEVDALTPVAEKFSNVVVAEVIQVEKHPEADRLKVCQVDVGEKLHLTIVCGAQNVRPGIKVPAALAGATLPNSITISRSKIRNVVSNGMLCSARELGMIEDNNGILELPKDAPLGQDVWQYLNLSDSVIDMAITPNRGDCLSVWGIATEVAALTECKLKTPEFITTKAKIADTLPIVIDLPLECPRYTGRIIRQVKADSTTPIWMQERLRRSGVRTISPIVDVMNYVMLELGQPMHAFDLETIAGGIHVRQASADEEITLLDGQTITLSQTTMVIADDKNPLAIAGLMGGLDSGVTALTKDIFLESAFFTPTSIARSSRNYNLGSDSSYRFERGIDPTLQVKAIERATALLLGIVGGTPGPIIDIIADKNIPKPTPILLRNARINKILGISIEPLKIENILNRLEFTYENTPMGWQVTVPARRSDISLEVDLIEEVMRLYGYEKLPSKQASPTLQMHAYPDDKLNLNILRHTLVNLGYHEVITYSFVDKKLQLLLDPDHEPKALINPITADMTVMRTNLWPGLVKTFLYNQNRQQSRIRLFEVGLRFIQQENTVLQQKVLSGLVTGNAFPEQWGKPARLIDFFDLKGDLESVFKLTSAAHEFKFQVGAHPALHPGQTAEIYREEQSIGIFGTLHPKVMQNLNFSEKVIVFEILFDQLEIARVPRFGEISKFPEIRRDIAILVDQTVPSQQIQDTIVEVGGNLLREVSLFDVYQGKGVASHRKSIALALTLQHYSRTLVDEEVTDIIERIIVALKQRFAAELRG